MNETVGETEEAVDACCCCCCANCGIAEGDVDIVYGTWKEVTDVHDLSSFKKVKLKPGLLPLPSINSRTNIDI